MAAPYKCPNCGGREGREVEGNPNTGKLVCKKCGATVKELEERTGAYKEQ